MIKAPQTGLRKEATMYDNTLNNLAFNDFEKAQAKAFWRKWMARLTGKSSQLLSLEELMRCRAITGQRSLGTITVAISQIIGSVGRAQDFDRAFMPRNDRTSERWVKIDRAWRAGEHLPPIELYKISGVYFVVDGNHRVSVAHAQGQEYIDAQVTEIDLPMTATLEMKIVKASEN
jgi:hypothetical protein